MCVCARAHSLLSLLRLLLPFPAFQSEVRRRKGAECVCASCDSSGVTTCCKLGCEEVVTTTYLRLATLAPVPQRATLSLTPFFVFFFSSSNFFFPLLLLTSHPLLFSTTFAPPPPFPRRLFRLPRRRVSPVFQQSCSDMFSCRLYCCASLPPCMCMCVSMCAQARACVHSMAVHLSPGEQLPVLSLHRSPSHLCHCRNTQPGPTSAHARRLIHTRARGLACTLPHIPSVCLSVCLFADTHTHTHAHSLNVFPHTFLIKLIKAGHLPSFCLPVCPRVCPSICPISSRSQTTGLG